MKQIKKTLIVIFCYLLICACGREGLAPVIELGTSDAYQMRDHVVQKGETLYAIAFKYDKDYRELARLNHLSKPFTVRVGQKIYLKAHESHMQRIFPQPRPYYPPKRPIFIKERNMQAAESQEVWIWPAQGKIVNYYAPFNGKKGIDISGKRGTKIYAANSGVVAYSGNGLSGYGNLIIIKHNNQYLTAYANNSRNLVHEGQYVKRGQVIAEMGVVDRKFWGLHFEIRKSGKPINPLMYIKNRD